MQQQVYIGNFGKGLRDDVTAFNIDNDAFPFLFNSYVWRQRVKRKRGTVYLGQLALQVQSVLNSTPPLAKQVGQFGTLSGAGALSTNLVKTSITGITQASNAVVTIGNDIFTVGEEVVFSSVLGMTQINGLTGTITSRNIGANTITVNIDSTLFTAYSSGGFVTVSNFSQITPGSIHLSDGTNSYTEPSPVDGSLVGSPAGSGTINYTTGAVTITGGAAGGILRGVSSLISFSYYPGLPVMGLRDFTAPDALSNYPDLIAFDTTYAYQCTQADVNTRFFSISYYKNTGNPVTWSGQNYQQFWSTNYPSTTTNQSGAFWATNNVPGMQFEFISTITVGNPTIITTASPHGLITGDYVWFNEITGADSNLLNGQAFPITKTGANTFTVAVNTTGKAITSSGIFQTLTATSPSSTGDGIRWYDGDMTSQTGIPTSTTTGWVNFSPPLTASSVSINGLPLGRYYLVGALAILPYKDRLLFFSPYVQTSGGSPIQLQDTVLWSWNGTPFYNALVPNNQTFDVTAYYVDQTGKGGWLSAGISQPIQTVTNNEDVLLIGFGGNGRKTRFAYTGNDLQPFLFYNINSELPSTSTFSSVVLDKGAIDIGSFGICITDQQSAQRIDLDIPNAVFQIQKDNHGAERVNAVRDYINEWIYFCYPVDNSGDDSQNWVFPTQTFFFNYRDNTWAVFYENFTCHGQYRANSNLTWATLPYKSWNQWTDTWDTGTETAYEIQVIAGNPQGYVLVKGVGTDESISGTISAMQNAGNGYTQITSYNHCLQSSNPNTFTTDFIYIQNCLGITALNDQAFAVVQIIDENNFVINGNWPGGTYTGAGQFAKLSQPYFQTKQFPVFWDQGRQVRIGVQKYLLDVTSAGKVTLQMFLSQNDNDPWNNPNFSGTPNGLEYSQVLYTCPESTNLGLTPANVNLQQQVTSANQYWHRVNTSLIGDTFQIGITLSDDQMQDINLATDEIVLHAMQFTLAPGPLLA